MRTSTAESTQLAISTTTAGNTNRDSIISSTSTVPAANREEAMLKTMSSLEGKKLRKTASSRDVLGKITRPAPAPPAVAGSRPVSGVSVVGEERRSLAMDRVDEEKGKLAFPRCSSAGLE